jgi:hypothetical protein
MVGRASVQAHLRANSVCRTEIGHRAFPFLPNSGETRGECEHLQSNWLQLEPVGDGCRRREPFCDLTLRCGTTGGRIDYKLPSGHDQSGLLAPHEWTTLRSGEAVRMGGTRK